MIAHILVIDDQPAVREVLAAILALEGHDVVAVSHGSAAFDALEQQPFDLVLLDVQLPGVDGWQILERLRDRQPELPVVMMSDGSRRDRALVGGADGFIEKPYGRASVVLEVDRVLDARGGEGSLPPSP